MEKIRPLVIAHRGASGEAPENTLAAFQLGLEQGCEGIELDIHLTKDGHLAVIHDENIKRTTNGEGIIGEMTTVELKKYDAGSWFSNKYKGEKIPLLEEVLDLVPKEIVINIEIKNIPSFYVGIEEKLLDLLQRYDRIDQVIVSSFDHQCLYRLKKQNGNIKIGLLYFENVVDHVGFAKLFGLPVESLHPDQRALRADDVQKAIENGLKVFAWTCNSEKCMKRMIDYGVSGIITNYPARLKLLIEGKQKVKKKKWGLF
ncbi:glycerophosphoryl diester phosphodiesterase [Schinkia azotoformans MEV2011]|uniref:Glycerophosphoryl diester phosphodiesterase n=1 Tax=Schinkia azotoformans MEV2011 TaxID=1348973 RepID=A0A072NSJ1_SCHAZ|nr:glycerophosphodiester phosphodiesterase [Schinkia azotoformans]KEF36180.1 glycerophosphoryl diester phosphodiesterase [Schinkia azotoformans MEV2011]MEC1695354.1 glycerophosphodiester phosphodiesterase [Schinkia azotoformans]MEC1726087.1 glycerophosphodiester phosphodiesterase [Schinkia azotoformans]MEC1779226.1 glycerophosphodiester phosphodiesterase [Schinkia azotoformans]MED4331027.1 glycerophosphodiester phosphodiesterase [Schinkia azotoformans]